MKGLIVSEDDMADIDVRVPDPSAPGGMSGKGVPWNDLKRLMVPLGWEP